MTEADIRIRSFRDEFAPALDLARVVIESRKGIPPPPLTQVHPENADAAADIEQRQRTRLEFAENAAVERIGPQFAGNIVPQPEAAA